MKPRKILLIIAAAILTASCLFSQPGSLKTTIDTLPDNSAVVTIERNDGLFFNQYLVLKPPYELDILGQDPTENQENDLFNEFIDNIDIPSNKGGCTPRDNCYIPATQKYYVFAGRKVIVINAVSKIKETEIIISNTDELFVHRLIYLNNEKRITFNSNAGCPYLYCVTLDGKLVILNYNTLEILQEVDPYPQNNSEYKTSVVYDNDNNVGFWYLSTSDGENRIGKFSNYQEDEFITTEYGINDIIENTTTSKIYVSGTGNSISKGLYEYDYNLENPVHITSDYNFGALQIGNSKLYANIIDDDVHQMYIYNLETFVNSTIDISYKFVMKSVYDKISERIFYTGYDKMVVEFMGIKVIDCITDQELENTFIIEYPMGLEIYSEYGSSTVYCSGKSIVAINNLSVIYNQPIESSISYDLCIANLQNDIVGIHPTSGNINILNTNGTMDTKIDIGGVIIDGCIKEGVEENLSCYAILKNNYTSYIGIVDNLSNALIDQIELPDESNVLAISCNKINEYIYLAAEKMNGDYVIYEFNIETHIFNPTPIFTTQKQIRMLFVAPNNKIYVGTLSTNSDATGYIYILDIDNNYTSFMYDTQEGAFCYSDIKYFDNDVNPKVFVVSSCAQAVFAFDDENIVDKLDIYTPFSITYDNENDMIYIGKSGGVIKGYSWDLNPTGSSINLYTSEIIQLTYNPITECLYGLSQEDLIIVYLNELSYSKVEHESHTMKLAYNQTNNMIYLFSLKNNEKKLKVKVFDCYTNNFVSDIYLNNDYNISLTDNPVEFKPSHLFLYDNKNNSYYTINFSFSNISVIQASKDKLQWPNSKWKWLSFPRLERYGNEYAPSIPVLERLNVFPEVLEMHYLINDFQHKIIYDPNIPSWSGELQSVQSTKGYKLFIDNEEIETIELPLHGAKINPETEMTLFPDQENWTGYYIDYPQYPKDCFDEGDWEKLTMIKTQYWSMVRSSSDPPYWYIKGKVTPFEYGDLVILRTDDVHTMSWIVSGEVSEPEEIPKTEYYTFDEQADYLPIFVQFDEASEVQEVAVKAEGEVRGAAVRDPGDTIVHVNAYLGGTTPGAPLEFETWNGYKSAPVEKTAYVVYNPRTKKKEKRLIYTGEAARYHWVSLKHGEVYVIPDAISDISCVPNPFHDKTNITFRLNEYMQVWVEIFDMSGKKINTLLQGKLPGGYYNTVWYGDNESHGKVEKGVYFYKIRTNDGTIFSDKMVLIK